MYLIYQENYPYGTGEVMIEREWYWEEVAFIPKGVAPQDLLMVPGHIFIKSTVVEELMAKGEVLKEKRGEKHTKKKRRYGGFSRYRNRG